jgi:ribose transport system permease protein
VRAVGDNETAARYAGLPIRGVKIWVYTLAGLLAGVGGVLYAAENHQGNPNAGVAYELDAIAAVVIGGTRLAGGSGSIGGTIVGTLTIGVLTNMLRLNNVDSNVEMMLKAVIIVLAVTIQRRRD